MNAGIYKAPSKLSWDEFCDRYTREVASGLAESTGDKIDLTFRHVDRILSPAKLRDMTEEAISRWQGILMKGRSPATVGIYSCHLQAALNWAKEMKMIPEPIKIRIPNGAKERRMKGRAILTEEHERILLAVSRVVKAPHVDAWKWFLDGLWWSGLRHSEASDFRCVYCGFDFLSSPSALLLANVDHFHPKSKGGRAGENTIASCVACNNLKGDAALATMEEAQQYLVWRRAIHLVELMERVALMGLSFPRTSEPSEQERATWDLVGRLADKRHHAVDCLVEAVGGTLSATSNCGYI